MIAFLKPRKTILLAVFMLAELAVLLFLGAQHLWPRSVPAAIGWVVFFGSYPWSLPWLAVGRDEIAATMAILTFCFALNVVAATAVLWYFWSRWRGNARGGEGA